MTPAQLEDIAINAFGEGWKTALANALSAYNPTRNPIQYRRVQQWLTGERQVPEWVEPALKDIARIMIVDLRKRADFLEKLLS